MKRKVVFHSTRNHEICGILSDPANDRNRPAVLMCHGLTTSKDGRTYVRLEEILNGKKFSTFRFDFFGHGESEGDFADLTLSEAVDDVRSALRFLKDSGYGRIGLIGSSFGGFASILAAGRSDDLFALALKSPVSDYLGLLIARDQGRGIEAWKKDGFIAFEGADGKNLRLNYSFFEDAEEIKDHMSVESIKVPTLIVHGDRDETVPLAQSQKTAGLIPGCRLEVIEGADHIYSDTEHFERMIGLISGFMVSKADTESLANE